MRQVTVDPFKFGSVRGAFLSRSYLYFVFFSSYLCRVYLFVFVMFTTSVFLLSLSWATVGTGCNVQ